MIIDWVHTVSTDKVTFILVNYYQLILNGNCTTDNQNCDRKLWELNY